MFERIVMPSSSSQAVEEKSGLLVDPEDEGTLI
jgi:hypothetical protein